MSVFLSNALQFVSWLPFLGFLFAAIMALGDQAAVFSKVTGESDPAKQDGSTFLRGVFALACLVLTATYLFLFLEGSARWGPAVIWVGLAVCLIRSRAQLRRWILSPLFLIFAASFLLLMLFQFPLAHNLTAATPANNFYLGRPIDFYVPVMFAESLRDGVLLEFEDWLGSDRPPLMSGFILVLTPLWMEVAEAYLFVGTALQLLILPVMLACVLLGTDGTKKAWPVLLILLLCVAFSPLFLHNISYLWPKILAALFCLMAVFGLFRGSTLSPVGAVAIGTQFALGFLTHGGSAFLIIAAAITFVLLNRDWRSWRAGAMMALSFVVVSLPWSAYKAFIQPPGDRLLKWHLLGQIEVTPLSFADLAAQTYQGFGWTDLWARLLYSIDRQIVAPYANLFAFEGAGSLTALAEGFVVASYYQTALSMGLLTLPALLGVCVLARKRTLWTLLLLWAVALLVWFGLPFHGARGVHEGSYVLQLLPWGILLLGLPVLKASRVRFVLVGLLVAQTLGQMGLFWHARASVALPHPFGVQDYMPVTFEAPQIAVLASMGGRDYYDSSLPDALVVGSYVTGDHDMGRILLEGYWGLRLPYRSGPDETALSYVIASEEGMETGALPPCVDWCVLEFFSHDLPDEFTLELRDEGDQLGQWVAVMVEDPDRN